jgi:hypothetical protein
MESIAEHTRSDTYSSQHVQYPKHLTLISHAFKRRRFVDLHLPAVHYPSTADRLEYIGIDPPMDETKRAAVEAGERFRGIEAWQQDPYGTGQVLTRKRRVRGWTEDREQRFWTDLREALDASRGNGLLEVLDVFRNQKETLVVPPTKMPWS